MTGASFSACNRYAFNASFKECQMQYVSFQGLNLTGFRFSSCRIVEADFGQCVLKKAIFDNCDLDRSFFVQCNLEETDFRTAYHLVLDPSQNKMKNARFSLQGLPGLLTQYGIQIE